MINTWFKSALLIYIYPPVCLLAQLPENLIVFNKSLLKPYYVPMCLCRICELHKHNKNRREEPAYLLVQDICTSLLNKQLRVLFI